MTRIILLVTDLQGRSTRGPVGTGVHSAVVSAAESDITEEILRETHKRHLRYRVLFCIYLRRAAA